MSVRILIADDHPIVRSGLRRLIDREPDLQVVGEVDNGADAVRAAIEEQVDLALLDVAMPRKTGLQAVEEIRKGSPKTRVLLLSMYDNEQYLIAAARAGATGYVLKSVADAEIVSVCRAAMTAREFLVRPPAALPLRAQLARARAGKDAREDVLTPRELEVLKLVAEGRSSQEIADELVISPKTVERHRSNMMGKLGVRDRVHLTRHAIKRGLIEP